MNKNSNKLIALLVTLDKQQRKNCRRLLQSPYFNSSKDLIRLFDELSRRLEQARSLEKDAIWKSLFKGSKYNDVRFRKFTSDLYRLIQTFIIQEELKERPDQSKLLYLQAIERQYPAKIVDGVLRNWEKEVQPPAELLGNSTERYRYKYLTEAQLYRLARFDINNRQRANFDSISENLDAFYLSEKLRLYVSSRATDHTRKQEYKATLIPEIIAYLRRNEHYRTYLPIAIYYHAYLVINQPEDRKHFEAFRDLLLERTDELAIDDASILSVNALNYCSAKIRQGRREYEKEYLAIYQNALKSGIETQGQFINPTRFKTTIQIALRLGDYEWVKSYIKDFQHYIPEKQRATAVNYNMAAFHFYQENYREAIGYLSQVDYDDPNYTLNSRTMLLAAYYELDEYEALESTFDAFSAYLNRHKELPAGARKAYQNLISLTRKLTKTLPGDNNAVEKLRKELAEKGTVASLGWVSEKLEELATN